MRSDAAAGGRARRLRLRQRRLLPLERLQRGNALGVGPSPAGSSPMQHSPPWRNQQATPSCQM